MFTESQINWLLESDEPWVRYRTLVDILDLPEWDSDVLSAREQMMNHPNVLELIDHLAEWPGYALKRHNDAKHLLYVLSSLADFGIRSSDPGKGSVMNNIRTELEITFVFIHVIRTNFSQINPSRHGNGFND